MKCMKVGVLLLVAAGILAACAEEREPINRVQPYALPKSFFIGEDFLSADDNPEFWTNNTLVNVGYGAIQDGLFTSTYAQAASRLHWQITEDMLIGRASYERIYGSDGLGIVTGDQTENGQIIVAYGITSHFDIVNAYNSTTGEKLNVVEENNYDRPWSEREYIRVDFSRNLMSDNYDFDTPSLLGVYGSIQWEPMAYYVSDPLDEEAPVFDLDNGYFDVTTKMWAKPGLIDLSDLGWGINEFPSCYLDADFRGGNFPAGNCNPVELTFRQSFRRIVDNDITPLDQDGWKFQAFGVFSMGSERRGFDREYGMTDNLLRRFQWQFPLYERSHYYADWENPTPETKTGAIACYTAETTPAGSNVHRDVNPKNGTEDECEAVLAATGMGGSKCDEFSQKCTLPYRLRTVKPMPWYTTNGSDLRFFEPTAYATHQWDAALRSAIVTAKYTECLAERLSAAAENDSAALAAAKAACAAVYPVYFRQTESNEDLIFLSQEMDDCRNGHPAFSTISGAVGTQDRETACAAHVQAKGTAIGAEDGVIKQAQMPEVVTLCHSPVQQDDPPMCGTAEQRLQRNPATNEYLTAEDCAGARAAGDREVVALCQQALNARLGDLRYHVANLVPTPQTPSPWGIVTSSIDPITGETLASTVNVWTYVNDFWSQRVVDWMRYAAGELSTEQVTEGENVKDWSGAAAAVNNGGAFGMMTKAQRQKRIASALNLSVDEAFPKNPQVSHEVAEGIRSLNRGLQTVRADSRVTGEMSSVYRARMKAVAGTTFEAELMNEQMQQLGGVEGLTLSDGILDMVSPLRGGNPAFQHEIKRLKQNALAERGMCELEMADTPVSITGLSAILQEKFGAFSAADSEPVQNERASKMAAYLAKWSHQSVIAHEMGHAVGHRHNFVGSSDAWNYMPQYWALRTKGGTVNTLCEDLSETGEECVGPRYFDPITPNEAKNLIWMWSFSSIMDYAGETSQDLLPIGLWDFAATRMFYGDSVAVYPSTYATTARQGLIMGKMDNFGGIGGYTYFDSPGHYSLLASSGVLDLIPECEEVDVANFKPSRWDAAADGVWSPVIDGKIVSLEGQAEGKGTRCHTQEVDYTRWADLGVPAGWTDTSYWQSASDDGTLGWISDKFGQYRVPYGFATDRWADIGNAAVYRHDNGADSYEIFNFMASQQEIFSIFDNYRRNRSTFTVRSSVGRLMERYLYKMRDGAKGFGLYKNIYSDYATNSGLSGKALWDFAAPTWFGDQYVASTFVFDHLTRNAQRPAPDKHGLPIEDAFADVLRVDDGDVGLCTPLWVGQVVCDAAGTCPNGAYPAEGSAGGFATLSPGGKVIENQLRSDQGEYDAEFTKTAGSYYDKLYMAMMFTESVDNFISESRTDFVDKRYRAVSIADLFEDGYRRWLGNNLTNDDFIKGARIPTNASGIPTMDSDGFWTDGIGWTKWWGTDVEACFPALGSNVCAGYTPDGTAVDLNEAPEYTKAIDPQLSWEVQKFLITWTYIYLPENQMHKWRDMMRMYATQTAMGTSDLLSNNVDLEDMIILQNPTGVTYLAKRYGMEQIFGKTVEKGIAARVLQYANDLLFKAYEVTDGPDNNGDGAPDWYDPVIGTDGEYIVKYDPTTDGAMSPTAGGYAPDDCDADDNSGCTCDMNRFCVELEEYISVLDWMAAWSGFADWDTEDWNDMIGIYN